MTEAGTRLLIATAALVGLWLPAACGRDDTSFIDDYSDVPEVVNEAPLVEGPLFEVVEDLVIGWDSGEEPWRILTPLFSFTVAPDGRIYTTTGAGGPVHIFDADGCYVRSFGGAGSGPGEFRYADGWFWMEGGSELWIRDGSQSRINRFDADGTLLETDFYGADPEAWGPRLQLAEGQFLSYRVHYVDQIGSRTLEYHFLDGDLHPARTLATIPMRRNFQSQDNGSTPLPFQYPSSVQALPDGRIVVAVPAEDRITVHAADGTPQTLFRSAWPVHPVTGGEVRAWYERMASVGYYDMARVRDAVLPETHPPFGRVLTDDHARIWVQHARREEESGALVYDRYALFRPDGTWIGVQTLPARPWIIQGDQIYIRDPGGEDHGSCIRRYRLTPLVSEARGLPPADRPVE